MSKNPEQPRNIDWDSIIRIIWGSILPHLIAPIREKSAKAAEKFIPNETVKNILASVIGAAAQIFEKEFKEVHFEILSDIFEQISGGMKSPPGKEPKVKPLELLELNELEEIAKTGDPEIKRKFLLMFSSEKYHSIINSLTPKQVDKFINVLISLEKSREEFKKAGRDVDVKTILQMAENTLKQISGVLGKSISETATFLKDNLPTLLRVIDQKAEKLADEIGKINQQSRKWRLF